MPKEYRIVDDAINKNNKRLYENGSQLCKVYGWTPEESQALAERIVEALKKANTKEE